MKHYFMEDGSYGATEEPLIIDTTHWTDNEWTEIDEAWESDRYYVAKRIASRYVKVEA